MHKKYFYLFTIAYLIGNVIILFNQGIFWDDWTLYNTSSEALTQQFMGNGSWHIAYIHQFLQNFSNPQLMYNILTVVLQLSTGYAMLLSLKVLNIKKPIFFEIIVLAGLIPYFSAKNTMICFPYTVCYALFFIGFYFLLRAVKEKNIGLRVLASTLLFISFSTNSLLFYYAFPLLVVYFLWAKIDFAHVIKMRKLTDFINLVKPSFLLKYWDLVLLPIVFYVIKSIFFKPTGLYAAGGYNEISAIGLLKGPLRVVKAFIGTFFDLPNLFFKEFDFVLLVLFAFTIVALLKVHKKIKAENELPQVSNNQLKLFLLGGLVLFFLGAYPYCAVGKTPNFSGYASRFQLLLPLGTATIIMGLIYLVAKNTWYRHKFFILVLGIFTVSTFAENKSYILGWLKQEAIMAHFTTNEDVRNNTSFLVYDKSEELDANEREYAFYALNGMAKFVLKDETRLICEVGEYYAYEASCSELLKEKEKFNMQEYVQSEPTHLIILDSEMKSELYFLKAIFWKLRDTNHFNQMMKDLITMDVIKMNYSQSKRLFLDE